MTEREDQSQDAEPEATEEESLSLSEENERLIDRIQRLQAEFENYRKRNARERTTWTARALEGFVLDLLPVQDSFDRALEAADERADAAALLEGLKLVHRQLVGALASHGIQAFDALGQEFDPNLHEAFLSRPAEEGEEPGTIVEEVVKGYRMGDRTIRATRGIVAAARDEGVLETPDPKEE